jgi:glycosyltransferase involved in cell wall biosynthesis
MDINVDIVAYKFRRTEEPGGRLLWLKMLSPLFIRRLKVYNMLIVETAWSILPSLVARLFLGKKCILHLHSVESFQDVGLKAIGKVIVKLLEHLGKYCDAVLVPSTVEKDLLIHKLGYPVDKVYVFPNFVDFDEFLKYEPAQLKKPAVVFVGGMNYPPNREAAEAIIKISEIISRRGRLVNFYLVGPSPPPTKPPVYASGYVKSTKPLIKGADMLIAPIYRGGGVKLKVLEYMASGKPIVTTKKAVEGIEEVVYVEADTPEDFADKIIKLLDGEIRMDFSKNIEIIRRNYTLKVAVKRLMSIIENVISQSCH